MCDSARCTYLVRAALSCPSRTPSIPLHLRHLEHGRISRFGQDKSGRGTLLCMHVLEHWIKAGSCVSVRVYDDKLLLTLHDKWICS